MLRGPGEPLEVRVLGCEARRTLGPSQMNKSCRTHQAAPAFPGELLHYDEEVAFSA